MEVGAIVGGRYIIEEQIGKGGFGSVYAARHTGTGRLVAVKCLATARAQDDLSLRRFFREAQVTSGLTHPNTIRVFDFGQDDSGLLFLAMELLEGNTLKQELRLRRKDGHFFTEAEALRIGIDVTRSLAEAHAAGLVHRDLKPDNIFLHRVEGDQPIVKVLDFGIVKYIDSNLTLGSDSGVPGTPAYMSPEQVSRAEIDARSDLYSLGVILYQLLAGKVPLRGDSVVQTLYMHVHSQPPALGEMSQTPVSPKFIDLIHRMLSKRKEERPQSAVQMREQLEQCLGGPMSGESSIPPALLSSYLANHTPPPEVPLMPHENAMEPTAELSGPSVSLFSNPAVGSLDASASVVLPKARSPRSVVWALALFALSGVALVVLINHWFFSEAAIKVPVEPSARVLPPPKATPKQVEPPALADRVDRIEPEVPPVEVLKDEPLPEGDSHLVDEPPKKSKTPRIKRRPKRKRRRVKPTPAPKPEYDVLDEKI